ARIVVVADIRKLTDGLLVLEPDNVAHLEALAQTPIEFSLEVGEPLWGTRLFAYANAANRKAQILQMLCEVGPNADGIHIHGFEPAAIGRKLSRNHAARIDAAPGLQLEQRGTLANDQHGLCFARLGHVDARLHLLSAIGRRA